jgi:hypothetical protein
MNRFSKPQTNSFTPRRPRPAIKLALSDYELKIVMDAAENLSIEKRSLFLQRLAAQLSIRSGGSVEAAVRIAMSGLRHDS